MARVSPALETKGLSKSYGKVCALNKVSLQVEPGVTAILGQNGAGKTTLIKCALGLENPSKGKIQVFGASPRKRKTRDQVGVMLQDTELPDLLTGRELLDLFASYYTDPMAADAVIDLAQVEEFVDKRYRKLSGGQKRRIQFALAIVGDPDLVFLDEPTTGLDTEARKVLWNVVRNFANAGRSVVLTTHYLEEADALADRVVILANGEIVADGSADDIRKRVGGAVIFCETQLSLERVQSLPGCISATQVGRLTEIRSSDTVVTLRALLEQDQHIRDLTISKPRMEDVFEVLTQ